jgi:hypothetical protein
MFHDPTPPPDGLDFLSPFQRVRLLFPDMVVPEPGGPYKNLPDKNPG